MGYVEAGRDPREVFAAEAAEALNLGTLIERYLQDPEKQTLSSLSEMGRRLKKNVVPLIGAVRLGDLHRRDISKVIDPVSKRGSKVEARRVFQDVRTVLRWGLSKGYLDRNPIDGMEAPAAQPPRERVLSDDEIRALWSILPKALARSKACQRIIKLCLITGQRVGEVAGMQRKELRLDQQLWSLPGARTKNGFPHTVPLTEIALQVIREALADVDKDVPHVFPTEDGALSGHAVARTILRAHEISDEYPLGRFRIEQWSSHDLRRTALTGMARLGVAPIVLGHVANHRSTTRGGITLAVYSQYTYDREKREALDLWAQRLASIISETETASVIPLQSVRRA
jgi:integrase